MYWQDRILQGIRSALKNPQAPKLTLQAYWQRWCRSVGQQPGYRLSVPIARSCQLEELGYTQEQGTEIGEWMGFASPDIGDDILSLLKAWAVWVFAFDDMLEPLVLCGNSDALIAQEAKVRSALGARHETQAIDEKFEPLVRLGQNLLEDFTLAIQRSGADREAVAAFQSGYRAAHWEFLVSAPRLRQAVVGAMGNSVTLANFLQLRALDAGCQTPLSLLPLVANNPCPPKDGLLLRKLHTTAAIHFLLANDIQSFVREAATEEAPFNALFIAMRASGVQSADQLPHAIAGVLAAMDDAFHEARALVAKLPAQHESYGRALLNQLLGNAQHTLWCQRYISALGWYKFATPEAKWTLEAKLHKPVLTPAVANLSSVPEGRPERQACLSLLNNARLAS